MPSGRRVGLFVTCLVDMMRPRIGFAALKLLEGAGFEVMVPASQTCCGQPGWNSGERASARALAEKLIGEFESCNYLVAPSGSCTGMIKTHYPALFAGEGAWLARVEALAAKSWELTDFLLNVARLETPPGRFNGTITYHDSCAGLREPGGARRLGLGACHALGLGIKAVDGVAVRHRHDGVRGVADQRGVALFALRELTSGLLDRSEQRRDERDADHSSGRVAHAHREWRRC